MWFFLFLFLKMRNVLSVNINIHNAAFLYNVPATPITTEIGTDI